MRYAAVLLLPLCLGLGYWFWGNDSLDTAVIPGGIQIEPGTTKAILVFNSGRQVELTDSSTFEQAMGRFKSEEGT